jgi:alpha-mannosidase
MLAAQQVDDRWWVAVPSVPGMGVVEIAFEFGDDAKSQEEREIFSWTAGHLVTPFYDCEWNDHGQLTSLRDLRVDRPVIAAGSVGNVLQVFEDKPLANDAWDIDIFYQEKQYAVETLESMELVSVGLVAAIVRLRWRYQQSVITQDVVFYAENPRIDFRTRVDWHEQHQLLKVAFPTTIRATQAAYDIQFGHLYRPTHWNTSWDQARFEVVGHQWADLSEYGYGISLMSDSKYGYDIKDGVLRLSLIKSAVHPDPTADQGNHVFIYALLPHSGDLVEGRTVESAWDLNSPLRAFAGAMRGPQRVVWVRGEHVHLDAVKPAEDGDDIIVRVHEFAGGSSRVEIGSDFTVASWQSCDLLERPDHGLETSVPLKITLSPFEIRTFRLKIRP